MHHHRAVVLLKSHSRTVLYRLKTTPDKRRGPSLPNGAGVILLSFVEAGGRRLPLNRKNELGGVAGWSGICDTAGNDVYLLVMCPGAELQREAGISWGLDGRVASMLQRNGFLRRPCRRGAAERCVNLLWLKAVNESACFGGSS